MVVSICSDSELEEDRFPIKLDKITYKDKDGKEKILESFRPKTI